MEIHHTVVVEDVELRVSDYENLMVGVCEDAATTGLIKARRFCVFIESNFKSCDLQFPRHCCDSTHTPVVRIGRVQSLSICH